ncbi:MAG: phospho-N-acetylmuramoyl-pentapeptide-transferase, partial [Deltaproteobacteria bacterium]|nr:phospho-N-acetylmuramoyl-pentapeptide-transferase [Deltaproteobacteria bacterium]
MLSELFYRLSGEISFLNVFRYITFRIILAALTSLLFWFVFGGRFIALAKSLNVGQYIRDDGPAAHQKKAGTPTMGGVLVLGAALLATLLWADVKNGLVIVMWVIVLLFGLVGFQDDFLKLRRKQNKGLSGKQKLGLQAVIGLFAGYLLYGVLDLDPTLTVPVFKNLIFDLGPFYVPFAALVLVGASNAVNLTDGLDGLATGPIIVSGATYMILAYCAGNSMIAGYLQISKVTGAAEISVVLAALVGSSLGFLWYNSYPADLFLGDTGSLSLGAALGLAALIVKQELLLVLVGGIFVLEAMSVILQVAFF